MLFEKIEPPEAPGHRSSGFLKRGDAPQRKLHRPEYSCSNNGVANESCNNGITVTALIAPRINNVNKKIKRA